MRPSLKKKYGAGDVVQLEGTCLACRKPWVQTVLLPKLGMAVHTCEASTVEVGAGAEGRVVLSSSIESMRQAGAPETLNRRKAVCLSPLHQLGGC